MLDFKSVGMYVRMHRMHIYTYLHTYIHTYIHTYMGDRDSERRKERDKEKDTDRGRESMCTCIEKGGGQEKYMHMPYRITIYVRMCNESLLSKEVRCISILLGRAWLFVSVLPQN